MKLAPANIYRHQKHGFHDGHPGIEKALIGAGIFAALILLLISIALIAG